MRTAALQRAVTGHVGASGGIIAGTDFTATRTALGQYTVRFTPPFRATPTVNVTVTAGNTAPVLTAQTADSFGVLTFATSTLAATDTTWMFTATGSPR